MAKQLNARIITKHDKEENWVKATSFIPKLGEIIVYESDGLTSVSQVPRIKVGNGIDYISVLPFLTDPFVVKETGKGLSTNDYTDIDRRKVEAIPNNPQYTDTLYDAGLGIGKSGNSFFNKGIVAISPLSDGVSFEVTTRVGPGEFEVSTDTITISSLVSNSTKQEIAQQAIQLLPDYIITGNEPGTILVNGKTVIINGWEDLGELAFQDLKDISDLMASGQEMEEVLITEEEDEEGPSSITKLWYRADKKNLFYRSSDNSFKEILPRSYVTSISPSEEEGYLTIHDDEGSYEVEVGSSIAFTSSGAANTANFTVTQNGTPQTIYTNGLPITGGTVTGAVIFSNTTNASTTATGAVRISGGLGVAKNIYGNQVFGAVWNDYAEYRRAEEFIEPGYIAYSGDDGILHKTTERLQSFEGVVSDTFGFSIGKTDSAQTPLAVAGRVLVYTNEEVHAGDVICAGPNGKACKMSQEEIKEHPDRIVGIVSEIPNYETWGEENIPVNKRIWIKVR